MNKLIQTINNFKDKKILVIGDIMLDKFIWGSVSRVSPEAPVQVVEVEKESYALGGAANTANNIAALSGEASVIGLTGEDDANIILLQELERRNIKTTGIIQDYAIGGAYAAAFYDIPMTTYDLDVLVKLRTENDYHKLYEFFRTRGAKIENVYIFISEMPVQFLPNYISPLFNSAIEESNVVDFEGVLCKIVSIEYLVLLLLTAFRRKDRIRIEGLLDKVNKDLLSNLITRFGDGENTLYERYQSILAGT